MTFEEMIEEVIAIEGVHSMDPDDPGNWTGGFKGSGELRGTKFGISAKAFPMLDIKSLTKPQAIEIYKREYFIDTGIAKLPEVFQFIALDACAHHGTGSLRLDKDGSIRFLQRALGVHDDGQIGPVTIEAAMAANPLVVNARALGERLLHMTYTTTWSKNSRGFARRVARHLKNFRELS
jgi:lysozyme family protein